MKAISLIRNIFMLIGASLLGGALYWAYMTNAFIAQAAKTEGTVVELAQSRSKNSTTYAPVVVFTEDNGQSIKFTSSMYTSPSAYEVGEKVLVYYQAQSPQDAKVDGVFSLWGGALIVGGIGFVFFDIGFAMFLVAYFTTRKKEYLMSNGLPIDTEFQSVKMKSYRVNGKHPYRIVTQWTNPETAQRQVFESENLWFDPAGHIDRTRIRVYIEPGNPRKYYMDVAFLPQSAQA